MIKKYKFNARMFRTVTPFATTPHIQTKHINGRDNNGAPRGTQSKYLQGYTKETTGVAWMTVENDHVVPTIPATALKSALRRSAAARLSRNLTQMPPRMVEVLTVGGIKQSGSAGTTPQVVAKMRNQFPLLAVFGAAAPHFIGGFQMGTAMPKEVFTLGELPIIRKDPLLSQSCSLVKLIDAEDFNAAMNVREAIKTEIKAAKAAKEAKTGDQNTATDNNVQTLHALHYIPAGIDFDHSFSGEFTEIEAGMLIHAFKEMAKHNIILGGNSARGMGGGIEFVYDVTAFDGSEWEYIGEFSGNTRSAGTIVDGKMAEYFSAHDGVEDLINAYLEAEPALEADVMEIDGYFPTAIDAEKAKKKATTALNKVKTELADGKKRGNSWKPNGDMVKFAIVAGKTRLFDNIVSLADLDSHVDMILQEVEQGTHDEVITRAYA